MRKRTRAPSRSARWEGGHRQPREGEWYIAGINGVRECLRSPRIEIREIWVEGTGPHPELGGLLARFRGRVQRRDSGEPSPFGPLIQGIGALVKAPTPTDLEKILNRRSGTSPPLVAAFDQIEDPMNLGQILRTCDGAGVDAVLLTRHRSVHLNQTVAQTSQGAFAWVEVVEVVNLRQTLEWLKQRDFWIVGCDAGEASTPWFEWDFRQPTAVVVGAEGKGLRALTKKTCDRLIRLPMGGGLDSLNVGAATAAVLFEAVRQRSITLGKN